MKYKLPNKNHVVVDDIIQLAETFREIDSDISSLESEISQTKNSATKLSAKTVCSNIENAEIYEIAPNRFLTVNELGNGFVCVDGGGASGGKTAQCCVKKSDKDFDMAYANIFEISKNGVVTRSNIGDGESGNFHVFCNENEIDNDEQFPKANLKNNISICDFESESNDVFLVTNEIEQFCKTDEIATNLNYGTVKIGDGISVNDGEISSKEIKTACKTRFGIIKPGSGIEIENGVLSAQKIHEADRENFGLVKLGSHFEINENGETEVAEMADASIIYKLSQTKSVLNGNVDLEEKTLIYRAVVTEDLVFSFTLGFVPTNDFTFILEIISDGEHIISFADQINPIAQTMPINRGSTKIYFTKKLGLQYYEAHVTTAESNQPQLLTPRYGVLNSHFLLSTPEGCSSHPHQLLRESYNAVYTCPIISFEFFDLVCVTHVGYWSRSNSVAMSEFIFRGSNDAKNWTTLIRKSNEIIYGKVPVEKFGVFRYYEIIPTYNSDDNKPGGISLYGTKIDNNEVTIKTLTYPMSSVSGSFCKLSVSSWGATTTPSHLQDGDVGTYVSINPDDQNQRWIKYEFSSPTIANILQMDIKRENQSQNAVWFKLEGSNDDETWDLLCERQYETWKIVNGLFNILTEKFDNETAYKFYRLVCIAMDSTETTWQCAGFRLYQQVFGRENFFNFIPQLSSASQDGFEVTASSQYNDSHAAYYAFDRNSSSKWASNTSNESWLQIKLPEAVIATAFKITSRSDGYTNQTPRDFKFQGSNDGEVWTDILNVVGLIWSEADQTIIFEAIENSTAYQYYRLLITANNGANEISVGEVGIGSIKKEYRRLLYKYDYLVPIMDSDNHSTEEGMYKLSSSSEHPDHKRKYLFDKNYGTRFELKEETSGWIQIEMPVAKIVNVFAISSRSDSWCDASPRNYELLASNDGSSWVKLFEITDSKTFGASETRTHKFDNQNAYKFYRLNVSNSARTVLTFSGWDLINQYTIREY